MASWSGKLHDCVRVWEGFGAPRQPAQHSPRSCKCIHICLIRIVYIYIIYIYIYIRMRIYMYTHAFVLIYLNLYTCICIYIYMSRYVCIHVHRYMYNILCMCKYTCMFGCRRQKKRQYVSSRCRCCFAEATILGLLSNRQALLCCGSPLF